MPRRQKVIARSIVNAILHDSQDDKRSALSKATSKAKSFLWLYFLVFLRYRDDLFRQLRDGWAIQDEEYTSSFAGQDAKEVALKPMGDMGYSGSTFFISEDSAYLVKSIPRHFEHSFFRDDLLVPYVEHMQSHPHSLLVRITDFLQNRDVTVGTLLGTAPTHHIVMENILYGQEENSRVQDGQEESDERKWQTWDLKPTSYFFPERDIAGGALASEATKSRLADEFNERVLLTKEQAADWKTLLEEDTKLLQMANAVDYSLFLVRIPLPAQDSAHNPFSDSNSSEQAAFPPPKPPFVPPEPPSWRTGVHSADGKYAYRAALLDFFWAKHKVHAKAMTALIKSWNLVDRQGPMSITTTSEEYRERFLRMCSDIVEVKV